MASRNPKLRPVTIERPLAPPPRRPGGLLVLLIVVLVAAALALGWCIGRGMRPAENGAQTVAAVSPTVVSATENLPLMSGVSASTPQAAVITPSPTVVAPAPRPVVQRPVVPPRPIAALPRAQGLTPRLPPLGDNHHLAADQVLYCLATGELLDALAPGIDTPKGGAFMDAQTEDYNRRCGAYAYSAQDMTRAMRALVRLRPAIEARADQLLEQWDY